MKHKMILIGDINLVGVTDPDVPVPWKFRPLIYKTPGLADSDRPAGGIIFEAAARFTLLNPTPQGDHGVN